MSSLAIDDLVLTPVPEPGRIALLAVGLWLVVGLTNRRNQKDASV